MSVADVCGPARSEPGAPLSVGVAPRREGWRGLGGSPSLWGSEELLGPEAPVSEGFVLAGAPELV